jgi:hypothetical protein
MIALVLMAASRSSRAGPGCQTCARRHIHSHQLPVAGQEEQFLAVSSPEGLHGADIARRNLTPIGEPREGRDDNFRPTGFE